MDVRAAFVSHQDGRKGFDGRCNERRCIDLFMHETRHEARTKNFEDPAWEVSEEKVTSTKNADQLCCGGERSVSVAILRGNIPC